uniref:Retrovirus-related Pol polyprotein from transposon TNT 1-94 n=1 Tax=Cajanus cajan TaxID=3821 RepID=A0A151QVU7_CAJCA|nr:Retrovirus-related Pol polyprotein from transposon TNT 1-94 [Cajanus cajan]
MALEEGKVKIEKFDGKDFGFWKMQIEDYLYQKKLYQPLIGEKPDDMKQEEWNLLDRQALGVIRLTLAKNVAFNIVNEKTTASLMKTLSDMYEKPSAANKVHIMRRLFNLKMGEGNLVINHINDFNTILAMLESVQIKFEDEVKALILLSSLPESWAATVTAVSSSARDNKLKLNDIRDLILSEDVRRRDSEEPSSSTSSSALNTESRGRTTQKGYNSRGRSKSRAKGQPKFRNDIVCWNCDKRGHFTNQCKAPKKNKNHKKRDDDESANAATDEIDDALICSLDSPIESWIMDSGASFHTTPSNELLTNYVSGRFGKVYLADGKPLNIVGKGDIAIRTSSGSHWTLKNVRHIPALKRNLISVGQLDDEGHETTFGDGAWKVKKGNLIVARGKKRGSLYMVADENMIAVTEAANNSFLWHQRLGHMSEKGMKLMATKGKLSKLKHVDVGTCEHCILGKQRKISFSRQGKTLKTNNFASVYDKLSQC